ncbi:MAG: exodeoxyribonuclease VII small subunit [Bacilli bacterium]|nr:exodeoxyribonuclease VII small subunit [Bacilli bacterium]
MEEKKEMSFEEKLERIDEILSIVENNTLPLEEAIKLHEEGMALIKEVKETLKAAEEKINSYKEEQSENIKVDN